MIPQLSSEPARFEQFAEMSATKSAASSTITTTSTPNQLQFRLLITLIDAFSKTKRYRRLFVAAEDNNGGGANEIHQIDSHHPRITTTLLNTGDKHFLLKFRMPSVRHLYFGYDATSGTAATPFHNNTVDQDTIIGEIFAHPEMMKIRNENRWKYAEIG